MLYEVKNGTLSLSGNVILSHFFFRMTDKEKIGIVGRNGAGKTTLLRLMNGEIGLDYNDDNTIGEIIKSKDYIVGYLRQQLAGDTDELEKTNDDIGNSTQDAYRYLLDAFSSLIEIEKRINKLSDELANVYDEKKATELNALIDRYKISGGDTYIKELKTGFKKFGFSDSDLEKKLTEFSGGQTTKISLLKLLLSKPDVLILDEPTNHLDIEAIEWIENYLKSYKKNIVVVSHDRMFLDNICNVIYDVENKSVERYEGNYTDFVEQKEINYQLKLAEYNKNVKEIERLTALADRFRYKATKAKMVKSKDKVIERIKSQTIKPLESDTKTFHVKIVPKKAGGKEVFRCENLSLGYKSELAKVSLVINRGDRLAVIGANGTGKSTFIKTIVGIIPKLSGEYNYGHEIEYEYFDQRIAENNSLKSVFDDFADEFPTYTNTEIRNRLGRFLFGEEDIVKRVCDLSGGEKVRLSLSKIFERRPNLLILDEPTNHLDILGKESLEEILNSFEGTVIFVSHDRYFVKKISNKILYFEKGINDNNTRFFEFGYEDYEKYIDEKESIDENDDDIIKEKNEVSDKEILKSELSFEKSKQKKKDERKKQKLEEEITAIELKIDNLQKEMMKDDYKSDFKKLSEMQGEIARFNEELEKKYEEWGQY